VAQLGVVYRFMLREHGKPGQDDRLLGSIDGAGTRFCDVASDLLKSVRHEVDVEGLDDPQPSVTFKAHLSVDGDHRRAAIMNHHEYGYRGLLNRIVEGDTTPFSEVDNQQVDAAVLISAPPARRVGFMAFHIPNRRGVKTGVAAEVHRLLREDYNLLLSLEPVVPLDAVEAAIENNGLGAVAFRKLNNPSGLFDSDDSWWTDGDELGGVELRLSPKRSARLLGQKLVGFIRTNKESLGEDEAPVQFSELATIDDHTYDELSVEVYIDGRKKVMRVDADGHSMSNAFSWELDVSPSAPADSIAAALAELVPE